MYKNRGILYGGGICQICLFLLLFMHGLKRGRSDTMFICCIGIGMVLCETWYLTYKIFREIDDIYLKEKLYIMEQEEEALKMRSREYDLHQREMIQIRQDMLTQIDNMKAMLSGWKQENGDRDRFFAYAGEMEVLLSKTRKKVWCSNTLLNVLMEDKMALAQMHNIWFKAVLDVPEDISIDATDLCSVFANLLDNALEAAGQVTAIDSSVRLKAAVISGFLIIKIENSAEHGQVSEKDIVIEKNPEEPHGIGLKIVERITKEYEGKLLTYKGQQDFLAIAYMKCARRDVHV